jgi:DNA-binding CsgD family transcriptional regulator
MAEILAALGVREAGGVVLAGAPGVGKTRLVREVLAHPRLSAGDANYIVATRAAASVPFGALSQLLTSVPPPGAESYELWRDAADQIAARASGTRLILGVDDAHLLDGPSAALIHQLVVHGHVSVVATIRVDEPAPDAITALWKDGLARRITIRSLPHSVVDQLLGHVLGPQVDGLTRQHIRECSDGNPLLLRELLAGALEEGALIQSYGVWHWDKGPRYGISLVQLVAERLAGLGEGARTAVEVIACGEPVSARVLEDLADHGVLEQQALGEAERKGLIARERSGRREVLLSAHRLYGEVIRAVLPAEEARRIKGRLIAAYQRGPARRRDDALRLATWRLEAGAPQDRSALIAAADEAAHSGDLDLAERLVQAARPVARGHALARVLAWQGHHKEAMVALSDAPPEDTDDQRVAWVLADAWNRYWSAGKLPEVLAELDAIASAVAGQRPDIDGARAWLLLYSGQSRRALDVVSASAEDAMATGWPFALAAAVLANTLAGRTSTAIALSDRGLAGDARGRAGVWDGVMLGWPRCLALLLSGRTAEARVLAEDGYRAAVAHKISSIIAVWAVCRGKVALAQGRLTMAETSFREAVLFLDDRDNYGFCRYVLADLAGVLAHAGDPVAAREWMAHSDARRSRANRMLEPWVELRRAWVIAAEGDLAGAASHASHAAGIARIAGQHAVEAEALYDAIRLGSSAGVPGRLAELAPALDGALAPVLLAAAQAFGSRDGYGLDQAATAFDELGLFLHAAETAGAASRSHRAQGRAASASASRQHLAALMDACPGARTPLLKISGAEASPQLTRRELQIALMASSGLQSKDIAAKLNLSVRTISNHLGHVFAKLGIAGRSELAARFNPVPRSPD